MREVTSRFILVILLGVALVGDVWLWLRLDSGVERLVSGSMLSLLLALWYDAFSRRARHRGR